MKRSITSIVLALSFFIGLMTGQAESQNKGLFATLRNSQIKKEEKIAALKSKHSATLNKRELKKLLLKGEAQLNLPGGNSVALKGLTRRKEGRLYEVIQGQTPDRTGEALFVFSEGDLKSGSFTDHKKQITANIISQGKRKFRIETLKEMEMPGCGANHSHEINDLGAQTNDISVASAQSEADGSVTIDVLVMWSPEASAAAGGTAAMESIVSQGIAVANQAYINSGILQRVNLVYAGQTQQSEDPSFQTTLTRFTNLSDGWYDEVHPLREQYKADEVVMIVNSTQYCGLGWLMGSSSISTSFASHAFAVVARSCASGRTIAHELGHNMGAHHDTDNATSQGAYPYSYGHRFVATNTTSYGTTYDVEYRTVMAYSPGTQIAYFSNPDVLYKGVATGSSTANNALTLNNTAAIVAAFRSSITPPPPTCTHSKAGLSISPTSQSASAGSAKTYTLTIKNNDSSACTSETFNLSLSGSSGWGLSLGVQSITLPAGSTASTSFTVTSPVSATAGTYTINAQAKHSSDATIIASASAQYQVSAPITTDTVAPSAPSKFSASVRTGKVNLSWRASTDNVGVAGYSLFRNGALIGQTATKSFSDTVIQKGSSYTYQAKAFDAAGNISAGSNTKTITAR